MTTETANFIIALVEARKALEEAQATLKALEAEKAQAVRPKGYDAFCAELDAMELDEL